MHAFISYAIRRGDRRFIDEIFRRALIPCASYAEFWVRYARHLGVVYVEFHNLSVMRISDLAMFQTFETADPVGRVRAG